MPDITDDEFPRKPRSVTELYGRKLQETQAEIDRLKRDLASEGRLREETADRMAILLRRAETAEAERDAALATLDETHNREDELIRKIRILRGLYED